MSFVGSILFISGLICYRIYPASSALAVAKDIIGENNIPAITERSNIFKLNLRINARDLTSFSHKRIFCLLFFLDFHV